MSKKVFVLDTNVLLHDAQSVLKFGEHTVYIPLIVIEELDNFKRDQNEKGRNARRFSRLVDELRKKGTLTKGITLKNGGKLVIDAGAPYTGKLDSILDLRTADNLILSAALKLKEERLDVVIVTKDINLRLKSDALGLHAEDYGLQDVSLDDLFSGNRVVEIDNEKISEFEKSRFLAIEDLETEGINPNEYIILNEINNPRRRVFGRFCQHKNGLVPVIKMREGVWGIYPKNMEQQFAMDALINQEVKLVSLVGKAGTGKTLMAIAAGLEMAVSQNEYSRVLVSRPIQPMGRDLGFLPGDVNEKLGPWMQPIFDNIDFLFGQHRDEQSNSWEELITQGVLHVEPLTYIRGRSIPGQYLIVDEAQNLTPHEIKTIITRAGEGTKIVLTGDCGQIDNPYLDSINNGLAYCVERLKSEPIVAHATLTTGERSELAEIASKYL